jgi:hypothetical protein
VDIVQYKPRPCIAAEFLFSNNAQTSLLQRFCEVTDRPGVAAAKAAPAATTAQQAAAHLSNLVPFIDSSR